MSESSEENFNGEMPKKPTPTDAQIRDLEVKLKNNMAASQLKVSSQINFDFWVFISIAIAHRCSLFRLKLLAYTATIGSCNEVLLLDPTNIKALYRKGQVSTNLRIFFVFFGVRSFECLSS